MEEDVRCATLLQTDFLLCQLHFSPKQIGHCVNKFKKINRTQTLCVWRLLQDNSRYLYVLRGTPSIGQCFQLYPARWFQPYCPSIPSASSYCLLKPSHFSSNQTHCDHQVHREMSNLVWLLRGLDCQWTQTSPPLQQIKHAVQWLEQQLQDRKKASLCSLLTIVTWNQTCPSFACPFPPVTVTLNKGKRVFFFV